jgi:glycosyltransferase involved in cell wall biosynthesis
MPERLISIIVPSYNRAHLLPKTLTSLQSQQIQNYEIIIVDDGSTDDTEQVIQPYLNAITYYFKKENGERAAARNYGAQLANGTYVNFFDSDDLALSNHTSEAQQIIEAYNQPEWFHLAYEWVDTNGSCLYKVNCRKGDTINKTLATGNHLGCNGVFIRKDIFLKNTFNENRSLSASEDYELWLRLAARYPLYYSNTITSQLIEHSTRSVNSFSETNLIDRLTMLQNLVSVNTEVNAFFGKDISKIKADCLSYISLHLSDRARSKFNALFYLFKALIASPIFFFSPRFFAISRNLVLRWHL